MSTSFAETECLRASISEKPGSFRKLSRGFGPLCGIRLTPGVVESSRRLDAIVMQPVRGLLGSATQLLISPDSDLNLIPFQALLDEDGHYLVQRYFIGYLSTGRDLLRLQIARSSKARAPRGC